MMAKYCVNLDRSCAEICQQVETSPDTFSRAHSDLLRSCLSRLQINDTAFLDSVEKQTSQFPIYYKDLIEASVLDHAKMILLERYSITLWT
jgi:hypothetical protein